LIKGPCPYYYAVKYRREILVQFGALTLLELSLFPHLSVIRVCGDQPFAQLFAALRSTSVQRQMHGITANLNFSQAKNVTVWCFSHPSYIFGRPRPLEQRHRLQQEYIDQCQLMRKLDPYIDSMQFQVDYNQWTHFYNLASSLPRVDLPNLRTRETSRSANASQQVNEEPDDWIQANQGANKVDIPLVCVLLLSLLLLWLTPRPFPLRSYKLRDSNHLSEVVITLDVDAMQSNSLVLELRLAMSPPLPLRPPMKRLGRTSRLMLVR